MSRSATRRPSTATEDTIGDADGGAALTDAQPTRPAGGGPDDAHAAADVTSFAETDGNAGEGPSDDTAPAQAAHRTPDTTETVGRARQWRLKRILTFGALPAIAFVLALSAGYLKWQDSSTRQAQTDARQAATSAAESAIAMLSYRADSVEHDLTAAEDRLAGDFRNSFAALIHDVVIPGSKEKHISSQARVPAAATIAVHGADAEVLVFVDQSVTIGDDPPTETASSVKLTLQKVQGRWLIAKFDPI